MKAKDFEKKLLETDAAFREAYYKFDRSIEISHLVVYERVRLGLTQKELAVRVGTKQSDISRIERGTLPGFEKLDRILAALGLVLNLNVSKDEDGRSTSTANSLDSISSDFASPYCEVRPTISLKGDGQELQPVEFLTSKQI